MPRANASCAPTAYSAPAATAIDAAADRPERAHGERRRARRGSTAIRNAAQPGICRSGLPCSAVQIALAWISAPGICRSPGADVGWTSCSAGAVAPTTTILPRSSAAPTRPSSTSANEYVGIVPVGPRKSISALPRLHRRAEPLADERGDRLQAGVLARVAADHAARIGRERAGGGAGAAGLGELLVAAEHAGAALVVDLAGGQDHALGAADRVVEREVVVRVLGRLGELDVVDDLAHAGLAQPVEHPRVQRAPERPLRVELGERALVDPDDRHARDGLRAADLEARVDRRQLGALERRRQRRDEGDQRDQRARDLGQPDHRGRGVNSRWPARTSFERPPRRGHTDTAPSRT